MFFMLLSILTYHGWAAQISDSRRSVIVAADTEIRLEFADTLTSRDVAEEDYVRFRLMQALVIDGIALAAPGAEAIGRVSHASKPEMLGTGGELSVRSEYLRVGATRIRLRGTLARQGADKTSAAIALTILFGPVGLIKHGKQAEIRAGTPMRAFVERDTAVELGQ